MLGRFILHFNDDVAAAAHRQSARAAASTFDGLIHREHARVNSLGTITHGRRVVRPHLVCATRWACLSASQLDAGARTRPPACIACTDGKRRPAQACH
jgi:hypothetical protein